MLHMGLPVTIFGYLKDNIQQMIAWWALSKIRG